MKVKKLKFVGILGLLAYASTLISQPKLIDREEEKKEYPSLQDTEIQLDKNISDAYKRLSIFGPLVNLAKEDRAKYFKSKEEPYDFRHTLRNIIYTPRNSYIRYVKESEDFLLVGFGTTQEVLAKIKEKVDYVSGQGVKVNNPQFKQRDGIELTEFAFIYDEQSPKREVIGSVRKSTSLFYDRINQQGTIDSPQDFKLTLVVTRIVIDNIKDGIKDIHLTIDSDPSTENMDDVITLHRYNQKPVQVIVWGAMHNTPNFPHRVEMKRDHYLILMDHFNILYKMVEGYSKKDSNEYNEKVIELLKKALEF